MTVNASAIVCCGHLLYCHGFFSLRGNVSRQRVLFFAASLLSFLAQTSFIVQHSLKFFNISVASMYTTLPNVGCVFFFPAFAVLNLSTIDRYERFQLILFRSWQHYLFSSLKVLSMLLGFIAAVGGVLPSNNTPPTLNYLIALFSLWTAALDCILNMRMIFMTLFNEQVASHPHSRTASLSTKNRMIKSSLMMCEDSTNQLAISNNPLPYHNTTTMRTATFNQLHIPEIVAFDVSNCQINNNPQLHIVQSSENNSPVSEASAAIPLPNFNDTIDVLNNIDEENMMEKSNTIKRIKQNDKVKRIVRLRFRLLLFYTILLAVNLGIVVLYVLGQFLYTDLTDDLTFLATSFGTMHVYVCLNLLQMFRSGLHKSVKRNKRRQHQQNPLNIKTNTTTSHKYPVTELSDVPAGPEDQNAGIVSTNIKSDWDVGSDENKSRIRRFLRLPKF